MPDKIKILMVCLGNICRSPLAEGILQSKLNPSRYIVNSCGTSAYHIGNAPDSRSIAVAKKYDVNISSQKASQFQKKHFDEFDYIYAMDQSNLENILKLSRNDEDRNKVKLILDELDTESGLEVPDPYYGGEHGFENVFQMLDQACERIASRLSY